MTRSDLDVLLEMGFEKARAELAVKKTGGCQCLHFSYEILRMLTSIVVQQALNWLEENQDKPLEELQAQASEPAAAASGSAEVTGTSIPAGEQAQSLVCNECGKKFRNLDQANFHASKT